MIYSPSLGHTFRTASDFGRAIKVLGLSGADEATLNAHGGYTVADTPRPETTPKQTARRLPEPVQQPDGTYAWTWEIEDIPLDVLRARMSLSKLQLTLALVGQGILSEAEGEAWLASGTLPAFAVSALDTLPDDGTRAVARLRFVGAVEIERTNPFIALLAGHLGLTDAQVDALFEAGAAL